MKKKNVRRRLVLTKFEKLLYGFALFLLVLAPLATVFSQAALSKVNYDVEKIKGEISAQEKVNESLSMKISELASLDKIQEVAQSEGLSYNNSNIKYVDASE
ncbi:MAG: cell division protein FtsL [Firmicutes bacterium]|nr:cell division protein FtsL [Bacillota bacterium]